MEGSASRWAFLRWRGLLENARVVARRTMTVALALACVTLAFTQWGFLGMLFVDGSNAYLVTMVVPPALAALTLGTIPGALMGLFSGTVLCLHARITPLDYYEFTYVTPGSSILGMGLFGLVLGMLLSFVIRKGFAGWRRIVLVLLSCLVASVVFNARFTLGVYVTELAEVVTKNTFALGAAQYLEMQSKMVEAFFFSNHVAFQVLGDTLVSGAACVGGLAVFGWRMKRVGDEGLREVFGAHLFVVVMMAFMTVITGAYMAVTIVEHQESTFHMQDEVLYLLSQLKEADGNADVARALLKGYSEDADGLLIIASGGRVIASDASRMKREVGALLVNLLGAEGWEDAQHSSDNATLERVVYIAPSNYSNLFEVVLPGEEDEFASLMTFQVGYLAAGIDGELVVLLVRPANMVFSGRDDVVFWVSLASLVLLAVVYVLTSRLLDRLVARRIDDTNAVLGRITDGDLNARIAPEGTREFCELSAGINVTVDALQGWIAEAASRMDSELAAAKAIQESALPSVFPPYPHITRFDVFASMNAAREVGGDFYDFFLVGDNCTPDAGKLAFVIADVSGKGVPASLFMMKAKALIRDRIERGMGLAEAMDDVNKELCDGNDEGMFVTVWAGVLDYATGHVEYANAGHNPPLLRQEGSFSWMRQSSGMALGVFDDETYEAYSLDCQPGDLFLLYTDGVTEAFSVEHEQYGEDRLEQLACENPDLGPRDLIDCVRASVAAHAEGAEQSDDITILALELNAAFSAGSAGQTA